MLVVNTKRRADTAREDATSGATKTTTSGANYDTFDGSDCTIISVGFIVEN